MSRSDAAGCRTTHVKLHRDYRMVEQTFKNVLLDVRKKKSLEEARGRQKRMEEERRVLETKSKSGGGMDFNGDGGPMGGGDLSEEGRRWQMQIQEDVSTIHCYDCKTDVCLFNSFQVSSIHILTNT